MGQAAFPVAGALIGGDAVHVAIFTSRRADALVIHEFFVGDSVVVDGWPTPAMTGDGWRRSIISLIAINVRSMVSGCTDRWHIPAIIKSVHIYGFYTLTPAH